ncbi:MAG TPA: helix-turn-helix domain-containing protein [Mycobacteriales bacterium]|nr:helix-turn-helix domain-containing protein [Mycobacteriales bacterium]
MTDRLAQAMTPVAAALAVAVDEENPDDVAALLTGLDRQELYALTVVLAAAVDPDKPLLRATVAAATKKVARRAATAFDIDLDDVMGDSRRRDVLDARAVTYYAAHLAGDNYSQIGRVMNRDHSTVMTGCSRVAATARLRAVAEQIAARFGWEREEGVA